MNPAPAVCIVRLSELPHARMCCSTAEVVMTEDTGMALYEYDAPWREPGTIGEFALVRTDRCSPLAPHHPHNQPIP